MTKFISYKGWKVGSLENKWIKLFVAPQLGGRFIQLVMDGFEFFFVNPLLAGKEPDSTRLGENGCWLNFGGEKIWPAPQGWDSLDQWPGPPDPVLDSGKYSISEISNKKNEVRLISPFDQYTGLQIRRDVFLSKDRSEVKVLATFKNVGDALKSWSVWPVCQMHTSGEKTGQYQIVCPINPRSRFSNGYKVMHGLANNPQYKIDAHGNLIIDYQYLVGKVGLDAISGWVAFVDKDSGKVFVLMHYPQENKPYPDDTSVQIWTSGRGMIYSRNTISEFKDNKMLNPPYMEMELLSSLQEIEPGEEIQFEYRMLTSTIPASETVRNVKEFAIIAKPLTLEPRENGFALNVKYGFFSEGTLKISRRTASEKEPPVCLHEVRTTPSKGVDLALFIDGEWLSEPEAYITADFFGQDGHFVDEIDRIK